MNLQKADLQLEVKKELARRRLYDYCKLMHPNFYLEDRIFLKDLCDSIQDFLENSNFKFLVINLPPRHGKSYTAKNTTEWLFGHNPNIKVMTASYNETLSTTFARQVRDNIDSIKTGDKIVYADIFPNTKIKKGDASASLWSLVGSNEKNYLATSPSGSSTGFGASILLCDDLLKNSEDAYNEIKLEKDWSWFCLHENTEIDTPNGKKMLKTLELDDKVITYNHSNNAFEVDIIKRIHSSEKQCYTIETEDGRRITSTPEHKFYTNRGYKRLQDIMLELWEFNNSIESKNVGGSTEELESHILRKDMCEQQKQFSKERKNEIQLEDLPDVWNPIYSEKNTEHLLLFGVQTKINNNIDEWKRSLELQGRKIHTKLSKRELGKATNRIKNESSILCNMSDENANTSCTSLRPQQKQSRNKKSNSLMQLVSLKISSVTRLSRDKLERVYDIEVENNHNFIANGILTHNCNTMLQRLEGKNWKVIIIMTRWSNNDLAGKILENFENVKLIKYKALQDDGSMLCDEILDKKDYDLKTKEMNLDIVEANYQQEPIDIKGRLYEEFKEWEDLPKFAKIYNQTDTADTGKDYLCSINYIVYENEAYILDVLYTNESMETTEYKMASMVNGGGVNECFIESNNGGRGFARNVIRLLKEKYNTNKTIIKTVPQNQNKESRILTASSWVSNHIYMPKGWKFRYPEFYKAVTSYQKKGKNRHDDAPDVLSSIYERITSKLTPKVLTKKYVGVY